ncbi:M15 family metallopeptidase [Lacinutrix neustonica]|uniref:M15 family metallopeptidase n=1 Tax=Lacinutrix neustonica TaxID=2980107 RepID=A0A9E8SG87_9FLAO|nr:M15 family metallopeptidase [Lacinutrix neustonica]WAC01490.1 M15 family metallopeptidase [Lacinutrix neustonica]
MKRKYIIKCLSLLSFILTAFPLCTFSQTSISSEELIGKGAPKLFGEGYHLREDAHLAFLKMKAAAKEEGINIAIVSSYRSYSHQKRIRERKFKRFRSQGLSPENSIKKIIEYSTIPGTSRHHWGTDIDLYDASMKHTRGILQPKNYHGDGPFCKLKEWMDTHAKTYGFYLVYTDNANRKGFKYEPWHYSYKALSYDYLKAYKTLDIIDILRKDQLSGSEHFSKDFIKLYTDENILDINPELL